MGMVEIPGMWSSDEIDIKKKHLIGILRKHIW